MHWDMKKLLSLGVDEIFLRTSNLRSEEAIDLVKGLLYVRERYIDDVKKGVVLNFAK